jgi:hypothetical protein
MCCVYKTSLHTLVCRRLTSDSLALWFSLSLPFFFRVRAGVYYSFPVRVSDPAARKHPGSLDLQLIAYAP